MLIKMIACIDRNGGLGFEGKLLAHIPEDLACFKSLTQGKTIVMGRKTFESLPFLLPNRLHVVLSESTKDNDPAFGEMLRKKSAHTSRMYGEDSVVGVAVMNSMADFALVAPELGTEVWIIGGASIYALFEQFASEVVITLVDRSFDKVDTYIPELPSFDISNSNVSEEPILDGTHDGYNFKIARIFKNKIGYENVLSIAPDSKGQVSLIKYMQLLYPKLPKA